MYDLQVLIIREKLADLYESEEQWSKAAQMLSGIDLDSSMRSESKLLLFCSWNQLLQHSWHNLPIGNLYLFVLSLSEWLTINSGCQSASKLLAYILRYWLWYLSTVLDWKDLVIVYIKFSFPPLYELYCYWIYWLLIWQDDDAVNAEAFINKASFLVSNSQHEVLNLQYKVDILIVSEE